MARRIDPRLVPYPPERVARYLADGSWSTVATAGRFRAVARTFGPRVAVIDQWTSMTYAELDDLSDQVAAGFLERGIRPGDPILFQVGNSIPGVVAWYGVLKAGAVPVATLAGHRAHEIGHVAARVGAVGHIVDDSRPERFDMVIFAREQAASSGTLQHLFTVGSSRSAGQLDATPIEDFGSSIDLLVARRAVDAVQAELGPEDVAVYQLSGGTTGVPKVIPRLHGEYWNNARAWAHALGRTEHSVTCHTAPIIHNAGITCALHATHSVGGCLVLAPADRMIALQMMREHRVDDTLVPHGMFSWIASAEYELAAQHLKTVILSGAKVSEEVFARVEGFGARVGQTFGMGEGLFTLTPFSAARDLRSTTVGTPLVEADEIRILEPGSERDLADGEIGELACRGWYTIPGYFDAPEHNAVAFTSDGFYRTGDLGRVQVRDGQRHLSIEGRIKDLINRGGEKINAEELELLLHQHPDVSDVAVVAMPDERLGERVCAYLVCTDPSLGVPELQVHLEALGVAKYKWPERVELVGSLPRTQVGKLDKKELREDVARKVTPIRP
jgi:2,3-dihydroxybenzoate-AMP ligase